MEIHQIRYALAVGDNGSFTRAAEAVGVSQPSLSDAVRRLETELGGPLFLRDRAGCTPTALGDLVLPRFRRLLALADAALADGAAFSRLERTPLRLGVQESVGVAALAPTLEAFRREHPSLDLELVCLDVEQARAELRSGAVEFVVASAASPIGADMRALSLYRERYAVIVAPGHGLAGRPALHLAELDGLAFVDRTDCEMRRTLLAHCRDIAIALYPACRTDRGDWLVDLVRAGAGFAVVPVSVAAAQRGLVVAVELAEPALSREIVAVRDRMQPLRPEVERLMRRLAGEAVASIPPIDP